MVGRSIEFCEFESSIPHYSFYSKRKNGINWCISYDYIIQQSYIYFIWGSGGMFLNLSEDLLWINTKKLGIYRGRSECVGF